MVIEYAYARISLISSDIITNKTLILSLFYHINLNLSDHAKNPHMVGKIEINTAAAFLKLSKFGIRRLH